MKMLITGAASSIAPGVIRTLEKSYELRLLDQAPSPIFPDHDWVVGSILDRDLLQEALRAVQLVVNFVIVRDLAPERMIEINVAGLFGLLETVAEAGIRRFVQVSSTATVIGHWYQGQDITVNSSYTTRGRYSLCKMLQEKVCDHVARNSAVQIVALRPWHPCAGLTVVDEAGVEAPRAYAPGLIDTEDFGQACRLASEVDLSTPFEIFHTVATAEARGRFDAQRTEDILGFRAREDFSALL